MSEIISIENVNEWLNKEIFERVIENHLKLNKNDYKFMSISTSPATKPGDNYLSILLRSKVEIELNDDGQLKSLSYVVKCLLSSSVYNDALARGCDVFPKEKKMYADILPTFEKFYDEVGMKVQFGPKCYFVTSHPTDLIVMEDLIGYQMKDRKKGLDENHIKAGLEWMGKFHAASMVYKERIGDFDKSFQHGLIRESITTTYQSYFDKYFKHYIEALKSLPNGDRYAEKMAAWSSKTFEFFIKSVQFDESSVNVLLHGDAWLNNLLFSYDDTDQLKDVRFCDFQLGYYGTFAHEIFHFMISSWQLDLKVSKFDEFVEFYHEKLGENLTILNYNGNIPKLTDLKTELDKRICIVAVQSIEILVFPLASGVLALNDDFLSKLYRNAKVRESLAILMPWLDSKNALTPPKL